MKRTVKENGSPDVILDFVQEDDLLFVEIRNIGELPAIDVKTTFDKPFTGLNGDCDMTTLSMFHRLKFLAPQRSIRTFLDSRSSYFDRRQPSQIAVTLQWRDRESRKYSCLIRHDLSIFKDIITVGSPAHPKIIEKG